MMFMSDVINIMREERASAPECIQEAYDIVIDILERKTDDGK